MPNLHIVEAEVHMQLEKGYRVKVSILDLGLYINGIVVYPPNEEHDYWSVNEPAQRSRYGKFFKTIEFNRKESLWLELHEACVNAVKQYTSDSDEVVLTDIPDEPINFDNISF